MQLKILIKCMGTTSEEWKLTSANSNSIKANPLCFSKEKIKYLIITKHKNNHIKDYR